jgi:hypothetical protein
MYAMYLFTTTRRGVPAKGLDSNPKGFGLYFGHRFSSAVRKRQIVFVRAHSIGVSFDQRI